MRSQAMVEFGAALKEIETPTPVPTGTEVLLKTHNAGVCHSDVHIHDGFFDLGGGNKFPFANLKLPHTMGHEIEGEIVAVGPDGRPVPVPPWRPRTGEERRRHAAAARRRELRQEITRVTEEIRESTGSGGHAST